MVSLNDPPLEEKLIMRENLMDSRIELKLEE